MNFIFDPSLVLYLPLYELDGASFMSRDAYGHLCTVTGAVWRPSGRYFDGSDDQATIPAHSAFEISDAITVEIWAYIKALSSSTHGFIVKSPLGSSYGDWDFFQQTNGTVTFTLLNVGLAQGAAIPIGHWYHIAATYDRANIVLYYNAEIAKTTAKTAVMETNQRSIYLAVFYQATASRRLNGTIGEVRIYNRALTPLEIQHNYLATKWRYRQYGDDYSPCSKGTAQ